MGLTETSLCFSKESSLPVKESPEQLFFPCIWKNFVFQRIKSASKVYASNNQICILLNAVCGSKNQVGVSESQALL